MHKNLEKKVTLERVGSFQSKLKKDEIEILDFICGKEAKNLGYTNFLQNSKINFKPKLMQQLYDLYIPVFYKLEKIKLKLPLTIKKILLRKKK